MLHPSLLFPSDCPVSRHLIPSLPRALTRFIARLACTLGLLGTASLAPGADFDETLDFNNNQVPPGWTLETLSGDPMGAQVADMRFEVTSGTDGALDREMPLPFGATGVEITLRCNLDDAAEGIGYATHLLMEDGRDFVVSVTKDAFFHRLEIVIGNKDSPALDDDIFTLDYGVYTFDILFLDGRIVFTGTKEVGSVTPRRDVSVPDLTISGLKTVRLEAMVGGASTAWIDDVQVLALPGAPGASRFANISTRANVGVRDEVLIGGFIVGGLENKSVIVRAIGPSLSIAGKLTDPMLELHDSTGDLIATNDNWMDAPEKQDLIDSGIAPTADAESALLISLSPGSYTAIVHGQNGGTGVGLVEIYDVDSSPIGTLANISTRGIVQAGDNVMIGGLIIIGPSAPSILVRALGPSLPVPGALSDPVLELHNSEGASIGMNDNWRSDQEADIEATTIPPPNDAESAILATLVPGAYTAVVRGVNDTTGVALVEAYQLP